MKRKFLFLIIITLLLSLKPIAVNASQFTGKGFCSTGWLTHTLNPALIERNFTAYPKIHNIERLNDSVSISYEKIFWKYYTYNGFYLEEWNKTQIIIEHNIGEINPLMFNATIWIEEPIEFSFNVTLLIKLNGVIDLGNGTFITPENEFPSDFLLNLFFGVIFSSLILVIASIIIKRYNY